MQQPHDIGVARGTLYHWIGKSHKISATRSSVSEKRSQDWREAENKALRLKNKQLKKDLQRKDKALAETAALLVLQKKVAEIWGSRDEED